MLPLRLYCKDDLIQLREFLDANWGEYNIIMLGENADGVNNIHEIIEHCDAVMVARGDMGVEYRWRIACYSKIYH